MLLQFKLYLIGVVYFFGGFYMLLFPPRNFKQSGAKIRAIRSSGNNITFTKCINYDVVKSAVDRLTHDDPDVAHAIFLNPPTAGNRTIIALELRSDKQSKKPGILIIAALNGMVWGASNAVLELAERLLYDSNYQTPFFNDYDWYLIPMGNPDGVHFTQSLRGQRPLNADEWSANLTARIQTRPAEWHKNTDRKSETEPCFGTNINRNFAFHWQDDVIKTPGNCSQWFPGPKPFSTSESQAIRKYVDSLGDSVQLAIHLHASFEPKKELMLYPLRYSSRPLSNHYTLQDIGEYAARLSRLPDGRIYEVHQSSNDGRVAGSVIDYLAGVVGIELAYLLKPYHQKYPDCTDFEHLKTYVDKAISATLSLVRGWRRSTNQNTLSFFGTDVEF